MWDGYFNVLRGRSLLSGDELLHVDFEFLEFLVHGPEVSAGFAVVEVDHFEAENFEVDPVDPPRVNSVTRSLP